MKRNKAIKANLEDFYITFDETGESEHGFTIVEGKMVDGDNGLSFPFNIEFEDNKAETSQINWNFLPDILEYYCIDIEEAEKYIISQYLKK